MNLPALPRSRRLGDKLTAISIGYRVVALAAVSVTSLKCAGTGLPRMQLSTPKEPVL